MRWKLLIITSATLAIVGLGLWCAFTILAFSNATELARQRPMLALSALAPVLLAVAATVFTYRHTARRRKTQAILSAIVTLLLFAALYFAAARLFPRQLSVGKTATFNGRY